MAVAVKVGPWGAPAGRGQPRDISDDSMPQSLVSITIWSIKALGGAICGFSYLYVDQNREPIHVGPWGNTDPEHTIMANIEMGPGEYLYDLSGTANDDALLSLRLVTNQHEYLAGAPLLQTTFSVPLGNRKVVAFFGRSSDNSIKELGIYVPVTRDSPVMVGPWGGETVNINTAVQLKRVTVYSTQGNGGRISDFSFTYIDLTGQDITIGPINGHVEGVQFELMQGEYVKDITGTFDDDGVTSLKFTTNQGAVYGPLGTVTATAFSVPLPDDRDDNGAVVGFFSRSGPDNHVALGVYVGLAPNPEP